MIIIIIGGSILTRLHRIIPQVIKRMFNNANHSKDFSNAGSMSSTEWTIHEGIRPTGRNKNDIVMANSG